MKSEEGLRIPKRKKDEVLVYKLGEEETIVYDLERSRAHCLNRTAALVWQHCTGDMRLEAIKQRLQKELSTPVTEEMVLLALKQLNRAHLLKERVNLPLHTVGLSRRTLLQRLGKAAAISLPLVTSIVAPTAVQAGGTLSLCCGEPCLGDGGCCPGCPNCVGEMFGICS